MNLTADIVIRRYDERFRDRWDAFVRKSKNGTFLFLRDYVEYHRARFEDCSLLALQGDDIAALLPANQAGRDIHSHQGLTYGGLVTNDAMTTPRFMDIFAAMIEYMRRMSFRYLYYKPVPAIYHRVPAEEDRYALFVAKADLHRRDLLSVVAMPLLIPMQRRRRRGAAKASKQGIVMVLSSQDWPAYWQLLTGHIRDRFGSEPVHTLSQIQGLQNCFPDNIRLHVASLGAEILAGVVIYESPRVARVQYICSSEKGRELGALDLLFVQLLTDTYAAKAYVDFGTSNAADGTGLNPGLIDQKEGFGARASVQDFYRITLQP